MEPKKKPPIRISDLEKGKEAEEEAKPGELTYVNKSNRGSSKGGRSLRGGWIPLLVPVVIALMLSLLVTVQYAPSKLSYTSDIDRLNTFAGSTEKALGKVTERVESIVQTMPKYIEKTQLETLSGRVKVLETKPTDTSQIEKVVSDLSVKLSGDISKVQSSIPEPIGYQLGLTKSGSAMGVDIKTSLTGTYSLDFTLVYNIPIVLGGETYSDALKYFYDHLASPNRKYRASLDYYLGAWRLVEASFSTGVFRLEGNKKTTLTVDILGLGLFSSYSSVNAQLVSSTGDGSTGGSI